MKLQAAQLMLLLACLSVTTLRALGSQQAHHAGKPDATASSFATANDQAKPQHYRDNPYGHGDNPYGHGDNSYGHGGNPYGHGDNPYGHDKGYEEWCDDGCPNPQIADEVRDGELQRP